MSIQIQTIKTHITQEIPSIFLQINNRKYLFNMPDSFQRFRSEHKINNLKSINMFFTRLEPQYINGSFGFIQTLFSQDTSSNGSKIFGPPGTFTLFDQIKKSIIVGYCLTPYCVYEFKSGKYIEGVNKEEQKQMMNKEQQKDKCEELKEQVQEKDRNTPKNIINQQGYYQDENLELIPIITQFQKNGQQKYSTSFLGKTKKIPGTVNAQKLQEYNIVGKNRGLLIKNGQLEQENGQTLYVKDFKDADIPAPQFLILDIQSLEELSQLQKNKEIQKYYKQNIAQNQDNEQGILRLILHMTNIEVLESNEYQQFLQQFDLEKIEHIFTDPNITDGKSEQLVQTWKRNPAHINLLNSFNKQFPAVFQEFQGPNNIFNLNLTDINKILPEISNKIVGMNYHYYTLNPLKTKEGKLNPAKVQGYNMIPNFDIKDEETVNLQSTDKQNNKQLKKYDQNLPKITFFGTGSMCPSKFRNVSGILLEFQDQFYLMDCGEGTYNQILERFGDKSKHVLRNLRAILITHSHSDHHLGSLHMLYMRNILLKNEENIQPVFYAIPGNMSVWYELYRQNVDDIQNMKLLYSQQLTKEEQFDLDFLREEFQSQQYEIQENQLQVLLDNCNQNYKLYQDMLKLNLADISKVPVEHCPQAYGIIANFHFENRNFRITYSGDTRPCDRFIQASKDADIMIHEGTFSNDLQENAESHNHSTTREAVESAIKSNSKNLILTHFSQRYSKTPKFEDENADINDQGYLQYMQYLQNNTILAFDQLSGNVEQYQEFIQPTWYIAKNLNIDTEESQQDDNNSKIQQPKKKEKKSKQKK